MNSDFKSVMYQKSDDDLLNIVSVDREKYQEKALLAAEEEIKRRNLNTDKIPELISSHKEKIDKEEQTQSLAVSKGLRFFHYIVDLIIVYFLTLVLFIFLRFFISVEENSNFESVISISGFIGTFLFYYIYCESKYQKTIAKYLTKSKVVSINGEKPSQDEITKRTIARLIPFDNFSFLLKQSGLHDRISDTLVIKSNK
jgi:uncharacterized RDD family membrane protein YckC